MFSEGNCTEQYPDGFKSNFQLEWFEISTHYDEYSDLIQSSSKYNIAQVFLGIYFIWESNLS